MTNMFYIHDVTADSDAYLANLNRIETSATLADLTGNAVLTDFWRSGLGLWSGAFVSEDPLIFVCAPKHDGMAGCSVWHECATKSSVIAAALVTLQSDPHRPIHFITPEGLDIVPENDLRHSFEF